VHIDPALKSLTDYLGKMTDQKREPLMFEEFDPAVVSKICEEQRVIVESCRKRKVKAPAVCLILDDLGDRSSLRRVVAQATVAAGSPPWRADLAT
jgi:hypothetical protein